MNRTDRLFAVVEELRDAGEGGRTAAGLAERFEVSTRTIKRDVSALQQSGSPIWAAGGPGGGYRIDAAATLPPMTFTASEAVALAAALSLQPELPFAPDGVSALTKVLHAMAGPGRVAALALAERVWLRPPPASRSATARAIDAAIREQTVVVLDYQAGDGRRTERRPVEPLALGHTRGHWFLMAWCRRRRDGRWFRLDRIHGATNTSQRFEPRDPLQVFGEPPAGVRPLSDAVAGARG